LQCFLSLSSILSNLFFRLPSHTFYRLGLSSCFPLPGRSLLPSALSTFPLHFILLNLYRGPILSLRLDFFHLLRKSTQTSTAGEVRAAHPYSERVPHLSCPLRSFNLPPEHNKVYCRFSSPSARNRLNFFWIFLLLSVRPCILCPARTPFPPVFQCVTNPHRSGQLTPFLLLLSAWPLTFLLSSSLLRACPV